MMANGGAAQSAAAPKQATFWQQFRATLIRNIIRKKRAKRHTLRELLAPIYFMVIIIVLELLITEPYYGEVRTEEGKARVFSPLPFLNFTERTDIFVVPDTDDVKTFVDLVKENHVAQEAGLEFTFLANSSVLEDLFDAHNDSVYAAIEFTSVGDKLDYRLRFTSDHVSYLLPNPRLYTGATTCREKGDQKKDTEYVNLFRKPKGCPVTSYYWSGFSTLQAVIDNTWIKSKKEEHREPDITLQLLPKQKATGDTQYILRSIIPLYLVISLSQFVTPMLMVVVAEKEKKIKESMKMVGLRDSVFWLSWFAVYSVMVLLIAFFGSILTYFVVIKKTSFIALFLLMVLFGFSMIMFAFMMTSLFNKAKPAGIVGGLTTVLMAAFYYLQIYLDGAPEGVFWALCLLSPSAMAMGVDKLMLFDMSGVEFSMWDAYGTVPVGGILIMLAVDVVLYGVIAAYLDKVVPTEYGTKRVPWFCFQPSYWIRSKSNPSMEMQSMSGQLGRSPSVQNEDVEDVPDSMLGREAVSIERLQKTFKPLGKPAVRAVKSISMKIYPGEITAILGHNGAGKTTLFNMLTGMTSATSGRAHIFGYDIADPNDMEEIRKMTGICPQHDVLFDELTPKEHLQFFARIRGMDEKSIPDEVASILADIDLEDKADVVAEHLSGGQKRKLSVGIALIGDPKLLFLDEPTAGVDPYSRRHMWSVLKQRKEGKVILLTTHFMDEADILADRKAIVSRGLVRCFGSSLFLKNKFGLGYHLTMVLTGNADVNGIRQLVKGHIATAEQSRLFGREIAFILPRDCVKKFPALFDSIEGQVSHDDNDASYDGRLGISSYGLSMTTLEEVFLQLGDEEEGDDEDDQVPNTAPNGGVDGGASNKDLSGFAFETVSTDRSAWQMFWALAYVRAIRKIREPASVLVQMVLPIVYVCVGILLTSGQQTSVIQDDPVYIEQNMYENRLVFPQLYTYMNKTGQSIDEYASGINASKKLIGADTTFAQLLDEIQATTLDFRSVEAPDRLDILALVNFTAQHSIPAALSAVSSMFTNLYGLEPIKIVSFDGSVFGGALFIGFTYMFIPIGMAMELIEDREIRAKNQLRVNGLGFGLYFGSFFLVLGGMMLVVCAALLVLVQIFDLTPLKMAPAFAVLAVLYVIYTGPALLFSAVMSYMFDTVENGQFLFPIASYFGFIPYIIVVFVDMYQVADGNLGPALHVVSSFVSPIYIPFGIVYYINRQYSICMVEQNCDELTVGDYLEQYEIWTLFLACAFHTVVWFFFLRMADIKKDGGNAMEAFEFSRDQDYASQSHYRNLGEEPENADAIADEDVDVRKERNIISSYMDNPDPARAAMEPRVVAVKSLRKEYEDAEKKKQEKIKADEENKKKGFVEYLKSRNKVANGDKKTHKKVAVRNLTFGVEKGEVFGLLGHNGAGKTTTMRMITAEEAPTCGRVRIGNHDITSNMSRGFHLLGYCPQFDALWRTITVREHLQVYAAIRGVPSKDINRLANQFMDGLRIREHAKKYAKDCSGGTKRKLSYAMSMLGDPKICLLDEPSTGMDPQSKRFVWDTVLASFKADRGAILTTHSMEEADALCNRVGIMVKGELRCLGSTQHLKNKYGGGYVLEVKTRSNGVSLDWMTLEEQIKSWYPTATLGESFADRRTYTIPQKDVQSLASAFKSLETLKSTYNVEEYSFGQTTLEQVFIEFAKLQEAEDNEEDTETKRRVLERLHSVVTDTEM